MFWNSSKVLAALGALVLVMALGGPAEAKHEQRPTAGAFAHGSPGYQGQVYKRYNSPPQQKAYQGHYRKHDRKYEGHKHQGHGHKSHKHYGHQGYKRHHQPYGQAYGYYGRYPAASCHRVSRDGYWRGRPAQIGGLKCFDRYGRAYIKQGSHRLLRYYAPGFVFSGPNFSFYWR